LRPMGGAGGTAKCRRLSLSMGQANPKAVGERSEAMVFAYLVQHGELVAIPFGDNQRYDLLLDKGERILRIQVKTGRLLADGTVTFPACSSQNHRGRGTRNYRGECDYFAVFCPGNRKIYFVPVEACGTSAAKLRVTPSRNNQRRRVRYAADYEAIP